MIYNCLLISGTYTPPKLTKKCTKLNSCYLLVGFLWHVIILQHYAYFIHATSKILLLVRFSMACAIVEKLDSFANSAITVETYTLTQETFIKLLRQF